MLSCFLFPANWSMQWQEERVLNPKFELTFVTNLTLLLLVVPLFVPTLGNPSIFIPPPPQITSDNLLFKKEVHLFFLSSTVMILCTSWFSIPPPLTHDVVLYHFSLLPICNIISHWVRSLHRGPTVKVLCVQHTFPMTVHMFLIRLREQAHNKQ